MIPVRNLIILAVVVGLIVYGANHFPILMVLDLYFRTRSQQYYGICFSICEAGVVLLVVSTILGMITSGRRARIDQAQQTSSFSRPNRYPLTGLKAALLSGEWRQDPGWILSLLTTLAVVLCIFGIFGAMFIVGPLTIKLILMVLMLYTVAHLAWTFVRS